MGTIKIAEEIVGNFPDSLNSKIATKIG